jgi:hypothetical protein
MASLTIGTKPGVAGVVVVPTMLGTSWRIARRQPKTCCEQTYHRRATSDTRAPGTKVSATIRAFSSADQRRRRPGPIRTSTRRYSPFASSLTSNLRIARSPAPQANQALPPRSLKKGGSAPLTINLFRLFPDLLRQHNRGSQRDDAADRTGDERRPDLPRRHAVANGEKNTKRA